MLPASLRPRAVTLRRLLPIAVLLLMALLYVGPVEKYGRLEHQLSEQRATLRALEGRRARLRDEQDALGSRARMVTLARECGWIFPGERSFVVKGAVGDGGSDCR